MQHTKWSDPISASDWLFALALLLAGVVLFVLLLGAPPGTSVEFRQDGKIQGTYPLSQNATVRFDGPYETVFRIEDGSVFVESTTCPNGQCMAHGAIRAAGASIVCVPNRVSAVITGGGKSVDAVTG